jgi:hypothetical protein
MPTTPEGRKGGEGPPSQRHGDLTRACLALVQHMAEPLTAIASYLEAASHLHRANTSSARTQLVEVIEKSRAQVARADEILRQMRDLLSLK